MKKIVLVIILFPSICIGQYTYFNNVYEEDTIYTALLYHELFLDTDSTITAFGSWVVSGNDSITVRRFNLDGEQVEFLKSDFNINWSPAGANPNMHVNRLSDGSYVTTLSNNSGFSMSTACIGKVSDSFNEAWAIQFDQWNIADTLRSFAYTPVVMPGDTILLICVLIYQDDIIVGEDESPTLLRFVRITADAEVIDIHDHYNGETKYGTDGAYLLADGNYWVFGDEATSSNEVAASSKYSPTGDLLGRVTYGNPDHCRESNQSQTIMPDGNVLAVYLHCIDEPDYPERNMQPHAVIIDPNSVTILSNEPIEIPDWTTHCMLTAVQDVINTSDGGYLIQIYGQFFESTNPDYMKMCLLKLDSELNVEWFRDYVPPGDITSYSFWDVIQTQDGGYMCLGETQVPSEIGNLQRLWLLKVDACGDVVSNGCPPPIGIEELESEVVRVFPNPASTIFNIQCGSVFESVVLKDITGKIVLKEDVKTANTRFDVSHLSEGIYMLEVDFGNGKLSAQKLVLE
jgi:hypothetical protein